MSCENDKERLTNYLSDQMSESEKMDLEIHLANCVDCQHELAINQQVWQMMGKISTPEPSGNMRLKFHTMLDDFKEAETVSPRNQLQALLTKFRELWTFQPRMQLAYTLLLLVVGIGAGYLLNRPTQPTYAYKQQIDTLSTQVQEMRQMMMLSLLENPSASERLRAVSYTSEINEANSQVVNALLTTLNNDSNVNVRLVTLEALAGIADQPTVREGLVLSITQQDSPLMQSALADVMVKLQEKRSVKQLRKLLQQEDLNGMVKSKIQESINQLI